MKKDAALNSSKKVYNKKELFFGIIFMSVSFVCIFAIFYMVVKSHQRQVEEYSALEERVTALNVERAAVKEQAQELKAKVGTAVSLDRIINEGQKNYGPEEKNRREGYLWIDRSAKVFYVTLGAVQGLTPGDKLLVYDGTREIGAVRVETPMDVISYVRPINSTIDDLPLDYYRVVIPK